MNSLQHGKSSKTYIALPSVVNILFNQNVGNFTLKR